VTILTQADLIKLIDRADPYGALHIVIEDGNCEDSHLEFCRQQPDILPFEITILDELAKLTVEEREDLVGY
jgi:hypothetical protein